MSKGITEGESVNRKKKMKEKNLNTKTASNRPSFQHSFRLSQKKKNHSQTELESKWEGEERKKQKS